MGPSDQNCSTQMKNRKLKVLLLSPPYLPNYMRNGRCDFVSLSATQWFPIWLGYCGALLEKEGFQVKLIDSPSYGLSHDETKRIVWDYKPDLMLIYTGQKSEQNDLELTSALLKKHACEIILVGPYFSIDPKKTLSLDRQIKYGIYGEFEYPVLEFLRGRSPESIENFVIQKNGKISMNPPRANLDSSDLDKIPFVSEFFHRHLDFKYYNSPSELHPFVDIMTGRGCIWGLCTYCLWVHTFIKGSNYNTRSIDNVIEEFLYIEKNISNVRSVMIQDDTFPEERAAEFSEAKLKAGCSLPWSCYARGNFSLETMRLMKKANCRNLHVGFESADNQILKSVKKGLTKDRMTRFLRESKTAKLRVHGDFAIGFPGETIESVNATMNWACELRPHTAQFQLMIPFPGTPFCSDLENKKHLRNGSPDYPGLSKEDMERLAKKAYRKFYISLPHLKQIIRHPHEQLFSRLKTYKHAIAAVFWKKWNVR